MAEEEKQPDVLMTVSYLERGLNRVKTEMAAYTVLRQMLEDSCPTPPALCWPVTFINDDRTLTGEKWVKVEDKETLSELIGWMKSYTEYYPQIWRILGPNNEFFGYLFYPSYHMYADNVVKMNLESLNTPCMVLCFFYHKF